jgi:DnaJ homolog subfamily C member 8
MTMIAEGAEAKKKEDEIAEKKRKAEEEKKWEDTREDRVSDWRSFQSGPKKKKRKIEVLG